MTSTFDPLTLNFGGTSGVAFDYNTFCIVFHSMRLIHDAALYIAPAALLTTLAGARTSVNREEMNYARACECLPFFKSEGDRMAACLVHGTQSLESYLSLMIITGIHEVS